jgi:ABC-type sugar transport systems, permease components
MVLNKKAKDAITGYLFILPNLLGFVVFVLFSVIFSLVISFTKWDISLGFGGIKFNGIKNYIDLFSDKWFMDALKNNLFFILFIPLQTFLALVLAVLVNAEVFFKKTLRTIIFLPYITNVVVISLLWGMLLTPNGGVINGLLHSLGIANPPKWLGSSLWVKPSIVMMETWNGIGYNMILYLAGLQSISKVLYEVATIDGAGKIRQFFHITIPMISPTTFFLMITQIMGTFQMWSIIQILTKGGPGDASTVVGYLIYQNAFNYGKMGYASAMSWLLFIIIFIVTLIQWKYQDKWVNND